MDTVNQGLQKADPVFQNVKQNVQSNTGLYIGIGGAILGVGAIIIGGITYYTNNGAPIVWRDMTTNQREVERPNPTSRTHMYKPHHYFFDEAEQTLQTAKLKYGKNPSEKMAQQVLNAQKQVYAPRMFYKPGPVKYAVGYYNSTYPGWRQATAAEWTNPAFQADLVQAHREGGGWPLLEEPLACSGPLYVAEGRVAIDGVPVTEVGYTFNSQQQLRGVYPAMNFKTKVPWTKTPPVLGNNWTVVNNEIDKIKQYNPPCLFIEQESGGKKTRRRKSKSRRTRKH